MSRPPTWADPEPAGSVRSPGMRFAVDGWDPGYGTSSEMDDDLGESSADVTTDIERPENQWAAIDPPREVRAPGAVLFVDGVRRIEARIWIDNLSESGPATDASAALCASYAAGTVCCCSAGAHLLTAEPRRGLFTIAPHAVDIRTWAGIYAVTQATPDPAQSLAVALSAALQRKLAELEVLTAAAARTSLPEHGIADGDDLLVIDGPLRGRQHLPRALGYIKSHRSSYLPVDLHRMVGTLTAGQRTPVFKMGTSWERHSWYLRLPCLPASPWAGVVRLECNADLDAAQAIELANLTQAMLPRFGSVEYKDARAPNNLYPIAGLERELRRRLGDARVLYRSLRKATISQ